MRTKSNIFFLIFAFALLWKDIAAFSWNVHFYINQTELAEEHCVNRNKPQIMCNGKCYLAAELKKIALEEEKQQKNDPTPPLKLKDFEWFSTSNLPEITELYSEITDLNKSYFHCKNDLIEHSYPIDHPPC